MTVPRAGTFATVPWESALSAEGLTHAGVDPTVVTCRVTFRSIGVGGPGIRELIVFCLHWEHNAYLPDGSSEFIVLDQWPAGRVKFPKFQKIPSFFPPQGVETSEVACNLPSF